MRNEDCPNLACNSLRSWRPSPVSCCCRSTPAHPLAAPQKAFLALQEAARKKLEDQKAGSRKKKKAEPSPEAEAYASGPAAAASKPRAGSAPVTRPVSAKNPAAPGAGAAAPLLSGAGSRAPGKQDFVVPRGNTSAGEMPEMQGGRLLHLPSGPATGQALSAAPSPHSGPAAGAHALGAAPLLTPQTTHLSTSRRSTFSPTASADCHTVDLLLPSPHITFPRSLTSLPSLRPRTRQLQDPAFSVGPVAGHRLGQCHGVQLPGSCTQVNGQRSCLEAALSKRCAEEREGNCGGGARGKDRREMSRGGLMA